MRKDNPAWRSAPFSAIAVAMLGSPSGATRRVVPVRPKRYAMP